MSLVAGGRPQVIAHRGGCALGPENTLAAFAAATLLVASRQI